MQREKQSLGFQLCFALIAVYAVLNILPTDFPYHHTHTTPVYDRDDHDVCRAISWTFVICLLWYFSLMIGIFRTKHALESNWGQRLLIYPNLIIGVVGMLGCFALYNSFKSHSEEAYAHWMSLLNGAVLAVNLVYLYTISANAASQGFRYGWNLIVFTSGLYLTMLAVMYFVEEQVYASLYMMGTIVALGFGAIEMRSWANKEPYKF